MKKTIALLGIAALAITSAHAQIVLWNFNGSNDVPTIGAGTISTIGGATNPSFNSGVGSSDPVQPGWGFQTTAYPAQNQASGTAGVRVDASTAAFSAPTFTGLNVSFDLRPSNGSSRWFRLDYTTDGSNWNLGTATRLGATANAGDTFSNSNTFTINDPLALGNSNFGFRVVSVFSSVAFTEAASSTDFVANSAYEVARNTTSTYGGGTWRFDMVRVDAIPEPSTWVLIGVASAFAFWKIRRRRSIKE